MPISTLPRDCAATPPTEERREPAPGSMLLDPFFWFALSLLALNDHVLKSAAPGVITGKLSDMAGLALAPVLAVSLGELFGASPTHRRSRIRHLAFWAVATALGFSAIELWEPAARAYSQLLGAVQSLPRVLVAWFAGETVVWAVARHVADPADLLTLPFCAAGLARVAWLERGLGRRCYSTMNSTRRFLARAVLSLPVSRGRSGP